MKNSMDSILADSVENLYKHLQQINIAVPSRTEGRSTEHCEQWSICRFLATYAETDKISFPVQVHHRDRPDFCLQCKSSEIGIEVTEAVPENAAAIDAYREFKDIEGPFPMKRHFPGEEKLIGNELDTEAKSNIYGRPWTGNEAELEWAEAMRFFIDRKVKKANKPGFKHYALNWLLIYDNWSLPFLKRNEGVKIVYESLSETDFGCFETIYIETPKHIWSLQPTGYSSREIRDLWYES